jgi:ribonuclease P protein component
MADPSPQPFPKSARLRAAPEFQAVFKTGLKHSGVFFRLHFLPGSASARLGLAVPKKAVPLSVTRNRLKRLCREAFRGTIKTPGDYVLVAYTRAREATNAEVRADLGRLFSAMMPSETL